MAEHPATEGHARPFEDVLRQWASDMDKVLGHPLVRGPRVECKCGAKPLPVVGATWASAFCSCGLLRGARTTPSALVAMFL